MKQRRPHHSLTSTMEGPDDKEDAYNCILTQYQDCVKDEPDEKECEKSKWNSFVKKKPSCEVKSESSSLLEEIVVLKSFLVQHTSGCRPDLLQLSEAWSVAAHCPVKQCGYCRIENEHTSNKCPAHLARVKPKVEDSMFVELMAVEKRTTTPPVHNAGKHPCLVSTIIEKAKRMLSSHIPLDPKRTCIQELTPTRTPSPV
ncbi:hypothetical protein DSO57_1028546 [Entomophthora muscae]|uniref:Uncharacterized protein n=1 Tax=Entomophthora muscae TaxID=34485 RepID=A0ACC2TCC5_9FUNG|nr:hypothetical protein DSO57_1028546 [Entomophthora muscae]